MSNNPYKSPIDSSSTSRGKNRVRFILGALVGVVCSVALLIALLLPATRNVRPAAYRSQCANNLKHVVLALHSYQETHGSFPPACTRDSAGRPLHSWRALILPFLVEQQALYESIDFSKPWDDPANAEAYKTIPYCFRCPSTATPANFTTYLAIVAPNGGLHPKHARQFTEFTDRTSGTLMVIEVPREQAVHWMAPQDASAQLVLEFNSQTEFAHNNGTNAAFADGSVRFFLADMPEADRRAIISIAGNDGVDDPDDEFAD